MAKKDKQDKAAKKARKAAKSAHKAAEASMAEAREQMNEARDEIREKMRAAREQMREAKHTMREAHRAAVRAAGEAGEGRAGKARIRIDLGDGEEQIDIPEEMRRRAKDALRMASGPMMRDLMAASLVAAGAAMAAQARRKGQATCDAEIVTEPENVDEDADDGDNGKAKASAKSPEELGEHIAMTVTSALARAMEKLAAKIEAKIDGEPRRPTKH